MAGDWRLTVTLPKHADDEAFELWLAQNLAAGDVTRHHSTISVYADDPRAVKHAEYVVAVLCDELETPARVVVERWNPGREEWQPPGKPVEGRTPALPDPYEIDFEELRYEIVLSSPERLDHELVERLQRELKVFPLGSRRLWSGTAGAAEAQELGDRVRLELPVGTQLRIQPFTRRRRWLRRQQLLGDYAPGGGS